MLRICKRQAAAAFATSAGSDAESMIRRKTRPGLRLSGESDGASSKLVGLGCMEWKEEEESSLDARWWCDETHRPVTASVSVCGLHCISLAVAFSFVPCC